MRIEDDMDIGQAKKTRRPITQGAHVISQNDIPEGMRTFVTIGDQQMRNNVSLRLIRQSQDLVSLKFIRPLQANSGELRVSTDGRLHHHLSPLLGGSALGPNLRLRDQLRICLRGRPAQYQGLLPPI